VTARRENGRQAILLCKVFRIAFVQAKVMLTVARSFLATRWRRGMIRDRVSLKRYQIKRLAVLQRHLDAHIPFYSGVRSRPFEQWPIISKTEMVERFAEMNVAGIDASAIRHALAGGAERVGRFVVGQSTGTSGNRGCYLISDAERFVWLGVILAKALPDVYAAPQ
jgi:phenylacetate-coenzyme A ligase PaaK-like adenylate-forming protein